MTCHFPGAVELAHADSHELEDGVTARMAEYKLAEKDKFRGAKIAAAGSLTGGLVWTKRKWQGLGQWHKSWSRLHHAVSTCCVCARTLSAISELLMNAWPQLTARHAVPAS